MPIREIELGAKPVYHPDDPRGWRIDHVHKTDTYNGKHLYNILDPKGEVIDGYNTRKEATHWLNVWREKYLQKHTSAVKWTVLSVVLNILKDVMNQSVRYYEIVEDGQNRFVPMFLKKNKRGGARIHLANNKATDGESLAIAAHESYHVWLWHYGKDYTNEKKVNDLSEAWVRKNLTGTILKQALAALLDSGQSHGEISCACLKQKHTASTQYKPSGTLFHVTLTENVRGILKYGLILRGADSNWVKQGDGSRYGEGEIYALESMSDACRFATSWDYHTHAKIGSKKITILEFKSPKGVKWEIDTNDPLKQHSYKGYWLKTETPIPPTCIVSRSVFTANMTKLVGLAGLTHDRQRNEYL